MMWFPKRLELIHRGNLGAGMDCQNCPKGRQGVFVCHSFHHTLDVSHPSTPAEGGVNLEEAAPFIRGQFLGREGAMSHQYRTNTLSVSLVCFQERIGWHPTEIHCIIVFPKRTHFPCLYEHVKHTHTHTQI